MNTSVGMPSDRSGLDRINQFVLLSGEYAEFAREAGVELTPYRDPSLPLFSAQTEAKQIEILHALECSVAICQETRAQGHSMKDSPALVWQAIRRLGLRPTSDLFSHMDDCSVIEIYSSDNVQIFRSFSFFRYCSYSLEELYCLDWTMLFARDDQSVMASIIEFLTRLFQGDIKKTISTRYIPPHSVREVLSSKKLAIRVGINWISPLYREGVALPVAAIALETGELIGASPEEEKPSSSNRS